MEDGCIFSCWTSAIEYISEQLAIPEDLKRMEVAAEAREGRLPLGQVLESCKL